MASRLAARALTGSFAFFLAGAIDISAFVVLSLFNRARMRLRSTSD